MHANWAPSVSYAPVGPVPGSGAELIVEPCGQHVLIRHRDEQPWERSVLMSHPVPPGDVVVLASAAAHRVPSLRELVPSVVTTVLTRRGPRIERAWLAVSGVGDLAGTWVNWLHQTAQRFGVEILAPHGALVLVPGGSLFVTARDNRSGWARYRAGAPIILTSARCPVPRWDALLPRQPLAVAGLIADPVPAGLALRAVTDPPWHGEDLALAVPVHGRHPKLVIGRPGEGLPTPEAAAALIAALPPALRGQWLLVPGATRPSYRHWLAALADLTTAEIIAASGMQLSDRNGVPQTIAFDEDGHQSYRPFGTVLRLRPLSAGAEVVDIAPPPSGWSRCGPRQYRPDEAGSRVRAEVTATGLLLSLDGDPMAPVAPLDPQLWTLTIGSPGKPIDDTLIDGFRLLISGLSVDQLRTARIQVAGMVSGATRPRLVGLADNAGVTIVMRKPDAVTPEPQPQPPPAPPGANTPGPQPQQAPPAPPGANTAERQPKPPAPPARPVEPPTVSTVPTVSATAGPVVTSSSAAAPEPAAQAVPDTPAPAYLTGAPFADRPSRAAEQDQFIQDAAGEFNEAMAVVNAALATWPALRAVPDEASQAARVDFVAVCLYLGGGEHGATRLNTALRAADAQSQRNYLPCLVSGLRRLPTQRRPVVRQARIGDAALRWYPAGSVLTEPGFLSASVAIDVAVAGADVDFLIWPRSARRTTALGMGTLFPEAVFFAGTRFRVLAVRTVTGRSDGEVPEPDRPKIAVLLRELLPHEEAGSRSLDPAERETLSRLDRVLAERHASSLRVLDDADVVRRLAGFPVGLAEPAGESGAAQLVGVRSST